MLCFFLPICTHTFQDPVQLFKAWRKYTEKPCFLQVVNSLFELLWQLEGYDEATHTNTTVHTSSGQLHWIESNSRYHTVHIYIYNSMYHTIYIFIYIHITNWGQIYKEEPTQHVKGPLNPKHHKHPVVLLKALNVFPFIFSTLFFSPLQER